MADTTEGTEALGLADELQELGTTKCFRIEVCACDAAGMHPQHSERLLCIHRRGGDSQKLEAAQAIRTLVARAERMERALREITHDTEDAGNGRRVPTRGALIASSALSSNPDTDREKAE